MTDRPSINVLKMTEESGISNNGEDLKDFIDYIDYYDDERLLENNHNSSKSLLTDTDSGCYSDFQSNISTSSSSLSSRQPPPPPRHHYNTRNCNCDLDLNLIENDDS